MTIAANMRNYRILALAVLAGLMFPITTLNAASTQVGATANFLSAISLTPTNMQFGSISFSGTPTGSDTVTLDTQGNRSFAGSVFSAGGTSTIAAGDVLIAGTTSNTVNVACGTSAVLAQNAGAGRITINQIRVAAEATPGTSFLCAGTSTTVLSFTLTTTTNDQVKVGGRIDGSTQVSFGGGSYSTGNTGGSTVAVDISYN